MKLYIILVFVAAVVLGMIVVTQWNSSPNQPAIATTPPSTLTNTIRGTVVETMNAGGYTYALVDNGRKQIWVAGPETQISTGQSVTLQPGMEMKDFRSDTLNRTFETIQFVSSLQPLTPGSAVPEGHPAITSTSPNASSVDFSDIAPADGGYRIADVYANRDEFTGKQITVRGRVVKFTGGVMGKNWIHVMDGTGAEGMNDLTITTDAEARIGDIVLVEGRLNLDRDFGFGYEYDVIVEDARITIETVD